MSKLFQCINKAGKRNIFAIIAGVLLLAAGVFTGWRIWQNRVTPEWQALTAWARTAKPGEMLQGNAELAALSGKNWTPVYSQTGSVPFLYSDNPEYLYNSSLDKGLAMMRLTTEADYRDDPAKTTDFGIGLHQINMITDPTTKKGRAVTLRILARALAKVQDNGTERENSKSATVHLLRGAYGLSPIMPVYAGGQCARRWFGAPNVPPSMITVAPGKVAELFTMTLPPETAINAMFDLTADNAFFLEVYVVCGYPKYLTTGQFAPYGQTIGVHTGRGLYWKRILSPAEASPFDAARSRPLNKAHFRFLKQPLTQGGQYLEDPTWDRRPEDEGKRKLVPQGGARRLFKGDYNVEFDVTLPVYSSTGRPAEFAIVVVQRIGMYTGAARLADGTVVSIPADPNGLLQSNPTGEGVLLARASVSSRTPVNYTFRWFLSGGSHGGQDFLLVPLGEE